MKVYVANAFSLAMLEDRAPEAHIRVRSVEPDDAARAIREAGQAFSAVRHPATADIINALLGLPLGVWEKIPSIVLGEGDRLYVFLPRWKGGRPPETREYGLADVLSLAEGVAVYEVEVSYVWK